MNVQRRQRPGVLQHDTRAIREVKDRSREAWECVGRRADDPITVHAKMNVNNTLIVEEDELVLASSLD